MNVKLSKQEKSQILKNVIAGAILIFVFYLFRHLFDVWTLIKRILNVLSPFIIGFGFSFLLRPLQSLIERKLSFKSEKTNHRLAVVLSTLIGFLGVVAIVILVLPDLITSIVEVSEQLPNLMNTFNSYYQQIDVNPQIAQFLELLVVEVQDFLMLSLQDSIGIIVSGALDFTNVIVNFFMAIVVSIYVSSDPEFFNRNFKRLSLAVVGKKNTEKLVEITQVSSEVFKHFFYSKGGTSIVLFLISWVILELFGIKYSLLISIIFGLFNLIPIFGFVISYLIIAIYVLVTQINQLWVVTLVLLSLKLLENILVNRNVVERSTKLPTFWILVSLILAGYFFGFGGLIFSVPVFTIVYIMINRWVDKRSHREVTHES